MTEQSDLGGAGRRALIEQAKREQKLIYHGSLAGEWWWTPEELERENEGGRFKWSVEAPLTLRPRQAYVRAKFEELEKTRKAYVAANEAYIDAVNRYGITP